MKTNNDNSNAASDRKGQWDDDSHRPTASGQTESVVRCDQCGHDVPSENVSLHQAVCHTNKRPTSNEIQQNRRRQGFPETTAVDTTSTATAPSFLLDAEPAFSNPTEEPTMVECDHCGNTVSAMNLTIHQAVCHQRTVQGDDNSRMEDADSSEQVHQIEGRDSLETVVEESAPPVGAVAEADANPDTEPSIPQQQQQQQQQESTAQQRQEWSCPRCTLINPASATNCDACGGENPTLSQQLNASPDEGVQVEVREVDPRLMGAVSGAASIASWGVLGALLGGPAGALVGGATGAVLTGATQWRNAQLPPEQRARPRFTFSSTHISHTPNGSIVRMTNNASGHMRTTVIRTPTGQPAAGLSLADRMIIQMLMQNAHNQGATNVDQMSYEELLQRFGVGGENRGADQDTIDALPLTTLDNAQAIDALTENQKTCNICLEDFKEGDQMRKLDCCHAYHQQCIDHWLCQVSSCPICKKEIKRTTR